LTDYQKTIEYRKNKTMFNKTSIKYFDLEFGEYTGSPSPKPLFLPIVAVALDSVLKTILSFATGDSVAQREDVACQKCREYLSEATSLLEDASGDFSVFSSPDEATQSLEEKLLREVLVLQSASAEKEAGMRIALSAVFGPVVYPIKISESSMTLVYMPRPLSPIGVVSPFNLWLQRPCKDSSFEELIRSLLRWNNLLNDNLIRALSEKY
jgi:hypothetical protein